MLFLMILCISIKLSSTIENAGTALFYNRHARMECWSEDDITKLRARRAYENLIPHPVNPDDIDAKYLKALLRYFRNSIIIVGKNNDPVTGKLFKDAIVDTIGAHMRSEILPTARFAYYAGYVPYRDVRQLHDFQDEIKNFLNTQGLGWKKPERTPQSWSNLTVAKILFDAGTFFDPCSCLITKRDANSCIHLPVPKLDDQLDPAAMILPFKDGGLISLTSPSANNVLLKYYATAARCILSNSPENCRHTDFVSFNNELWHWMKRDVAPHLIDEKLYAAYGGVLRVAAAVQNYGKGLSRRNLFEDEDSGITKWHPWKSLTQTYGYSNPDYTPQIYVGLVFLTAISIYILQICYNYICGDYNDCRCKGRSGSLLLRPKEVSYAQIETSIPAMLPSHSASFCNDNKRTQSGSKSRPASQGSVRTQKVYDLNENAEKLMAVIMSDNRETSNESSESQFSDDCNVTAVDAGRIRTISPPKLQASVTQLKLDKSSRNDTSSMIPTYSTSTATRTVTATYDDKNASGSAWSVSECSTSTQSLSSTVSKSRKSRKSRDLAWAKKVISRHSTRSTTKSTSRTEFDRNSFTTPP